MYYDDTRFKIRGTEEHRSVRDADDPLFFAAFAVNRRQAAIQSRIDWGL
ncbi:hypothetical protein [Schaedlerella arabinosiphila]|nr:hypothetical protein [Schaedlerella arabinosiphila]MDE7068605.1 hypothetical protein [Schaedlerella arabinosiphila]